MQSKGAIRLVAVLLILACLWQLSFTLVSKIYDARAERRAEQAVLDFQGTAEYEALPENERAFALDAVRKESARSYTDSVSSVKVYFGYTLKQVREKEINLGLDLKGGMNVVLQVQLEDVIKALAEREKLQDPQFVQALAEAKAESVTSTKDIITLFGEKWAAITGGTPLNQVFGTQAMQGRITPETADDRVLEVVREEADAAVENSYKVLRNRIDRFGVTQPNIQKVGNSGRILVELPGVKEPERVRKLLQGTASLEFWETMDNQDIFPILREINEMLARLQESEAPAAEAARPSEETDLLAEELGDKAASQQRDQYRKQNPLLGLLIPALDRNGAVMGGACIGYADYADTAKINRIFERPEVKDLLPAEFVPMWTVKPSRYGDGNTFELVAIFDKSEVGTASLDGGVVTDARVQFSDTRGGYPAVSMSMNPEGANEWARITRENIGKQVAVVLDGMVYSYPRVNSEINGGNSEITGDFSLEEAEDLANVLKSGKLPAPATIVQESVVGPSLGSESISSGLLSFVLAFLLVLVYMVFFYQGAGLVADLALLCNVVLLFGTLAAFGAVLTLPGIAGLVLTLGMAVDANVIIYERIKEELRAGKGLSQAIRDGYSNAYSAIIDGQITTLLTGFVLFVFGSGPVQGFATTLIIGIFTSVLSSIFITRLVFEDRIAAGKGITFDNDMTRNFLQNTRVKFIEGRKGAYIFSGVLVALSLCSIFTKGFTYGVDFTGGRTYVVRFDQEVKVEDVREATLDVFNAAAAADESIKNSSVEVKEFGGASQVKITTSYKFDAQGENDPAVDGEIEQMLFQALQPFYVEEVSFDDFRSTVNNPNGIISSDKVDASIASDIKRGAIVAVIFALLVIFIYIAIRFRKWTYGLGGVVSLAHTAIIVIGFFSFFSGILPFTLDVDSTFIAAILTIIGYAINDNVVIFDRIREYRANHPKAELKVTVNEALNATLSRTMNTSLTTLVTMLSIAIFGGESIRGLAVALCLGIVIGTYASIFIGTTVMYDMEMSARKKELKK